MVSFALPTFVWTDFIIPVLFLIAVVIPFGRIFRRAGFSWAWSLLCFVPFFGWFAAWLVLATRDWPGRRA